LLTDQTEKNTAGKRFAEMMEQRTKIATSSTPTLSASDERIRKEGILHNPGQKATQAELEVTRKNVIAAYKQVQKKRKAENEN
jgi:hypothetical protein